MNMLPLLFKMLYSEWRFSKLFYPLCRIVFGYLNVLPQQCDSVIFSLEDKVLTSKRYLNYLLCTKYKYC